MLSPSGHAWQSARATLGCSPTPVPRLAVPQQPGLFEGYNEPPFLACFHSALGLHIVPQPSLWLTRLLTAWPLPCQPRVVRPLGFGP